MRHIELSKRREVVPTDHRQESLEGEATSLLDQLIKQYDLENAFKVAAAEGEGYRGETEFNFG